MNTFNKIINSISFYEFLGLITYIFFKVLYTYITGINNVFVNNDIINSYITMIVAYLWIQLFTRYIRIKFIKKEMPIINNNFNEKI